MADSILRLKVSSEEYDNKLKRAAEGLQRYADECRKAGGTLEHLDDGVLEFTKSLGNMEAVSKSAKGSINEMTKTFTELSVVYNRLTDEEKAAPFGKALADSLNTLKGRIQEGKTELDDISKSLNGGAGLKDALDAVAGKFGLSTDLITKFGGVIGVTTTALKVAKDAFLQSESNIDEWGRVVKGAEGAYDIFLQTLNNGNWSNFFSNLSQAITGARDLYDAFDRLNSIKANNAVAIATTQAEIQQLRLLKQQGQDVDDKIKDATSRLAALQAQSANAGINAGRTQVTTTLRNGVNSIGGTQINDATLNRVADNISKQGQAYFDYMKRRAVELEKQGMVTKTQTINDSQGGTYERQYKVFDISALSQEQQKQYAIAKTVTERETEIQKGLSVWSQSVQEQASATREQFKGNRYALQGSGGSGDGRINSQTPKTEEQLNNENIQKLTQEYIKATDERRKAIEAEIKGLQQRNEEIQKLKDIALGKFKDDGSLPALTRQLQDLQKQQSESANGNEWDEYQKKIEATNDKINVLKGNLPKDKQATFTIDVNTEQLEQLRMLLPTEDKTVRINVEEGTVNLPQVPTDEKTIKVNITADTADAMKQVRDLVSDIEGTSVVIEPKVEVQEPDLRTPFERLQDSIRIKIAEQNMEVDTNTLQTLMQTAIKNGIDSLNPDFSSLQEKMREGMNIPDETWQALQDQINEKLKELGIEPIKIDFKTGNISNGKQENMTAKAMEKFNGDFSKVTGGVSSIVSGIQQMGVDIPNEIQNIFGVLSGISSIMTGITAILTLIEIDTKTTAAASVTDALIPFARGGIVPHAANGYFVPGNNYSGDTTPIMANAGELVLNKAQQSTLASELQNGGNRIQVIGRLSGEQLFICAENWAKRTGKGEFVTWR